MNPREIARERARTIRIEDMLEAERQAMRGINSGTSSGTTLNYDEPVVLDAPFGEPPDIRETIMKRARKRHLTKNERDLLHKPESDWTESKRGEVCINHSSLDVSDIVSKYHLA